MCTHVFTLRPAGKSSLLDILAQRKQVGELTGQVLLNGRKASRKALVCRSAYVPQVRDMCVCVCVCARACAVCMHVLCVCMHACAVTYVGATPGAVVHMPMMPVCNSTTCGARSLYLCVYVYVSTYNLWDCTHGMCVGVPLVLPALGALHAWVHVRACSAG